MEPASKPAPRNGLRLFRGGVVIIYWIALPFAVLGALSGLLGIMLPDGQGGAWQMQITAASALLTLLLGWRLWLNTRALGWNGGLPRGKRLLVIWIPFAILAVVGLCLIGIGAIWIAVPHLLPEGEADRNVYLLATAAGGGVALVGALMFWPLVRLLRRKPTPEVSTPEA